MMTTSRLLFCERGSSAVELGIMLSVFLSMIFGIINVAMMLWTLSSLHYAAETAARYAAICSPSCSPAVTTYAANQYFGQNLSGSNPFTYNASGCGNTVTAGYDYQLWPLIRTFTIRLNTSACAV
jgi:hypothetical protein